MSKFLQVQDDIFSIFGSAEWEAQGLKTYPREFGVIETALFEDRALRLSILMNREGINLISLAGLLMIEIFTLGSRGPKIIVETADTLDNFLVGRTLSTYLGLSTQFFNSTLGLSQQDKINPRMVSTIYSISFTHNGAF